MQIVPNLDFNGDCEKAIEIGKLNAWNWYKYALVYAVRKDRELMLIKLGKAVRMEPSLTGKCKSDEDFKPYRNDPDFRKLVGSRTFPAGD